MEAPLCIKCSTKHWSRMPCPAMKPVKELVTQIVSVDKVPLLQGAGWVKHPATLVVSNAVSNATEASPVTHKTSADRVKKWRAEHAEENRVRQRAYMRKNRAKP